MNLPNPKSKNELYKWALRRNNSLSVFDEMYEFYEYADIKDWIRSISCLYPENLVIDTVNEPAQFFRYRMFFMGQLLYKTRFKDNIISMIGEKTFKRYFQ